MTDTLDATTRYRPYPAYRDSGVEWLGEVPAHWDVKRLKYCASVNMGQSPDSEECNIEGSGPPFLQGNAEFGAVHPQPKLYCPSARKFAQPEDILLSVRAPVGALNVANRVYGIGRGLCAIKFNTEFIDFKFGLYMLRIVRQELTATATGTTYDAVSVDDVNVLSVLLPPLPEQRAIVAFLDRETTKLDALITRKERLIALLEEKRAALISHAVTKGLDDAAPMRDSGVSWLGEVPAHWEVSCLKFIMSHIVDCLHATPTYIEGGDFPAIRTADVEPGKVDTDNAKRLDKEQYEKWIGRLVPREGDILYSREGERYGIAAVVPPNTKLCISQRMMLFRARVPHVSDYFMWQLNCPHVYQQASQDVMGSTAPHVNIEHIRNFFLLVPPICEQKAIASYIYTESTHFDALIAKNRRHIGLLRERRAALIAAAVTGKIDVRDLTP